jgi:hypothetical protein
LADRFSLPVNTVIKASASEGWPILRARYMESQLALSDSLSSLVIASKGESLLIDRFRSVCVAALEQIGVEFEALKLLEKPSQQGRRIDLGQKLSFSAKNWADTLKSLGVTGLPKALRDTIDRLPGASGDGWENGVKAALTQLNLSVTVNGQSQKPVEVVQDKPALSV